MSNPAHYETARKARDPRFDGQFFVAVKSTGIFCRSVCPAPLPKEQNVEYFTLAPVAMQAGYRPCLRCRPDSAPGSFAWKGVDTTVERSVKLFKQFPELSLQQISEKLGVSDRYLRALFSRKLGISPKKYRLYEQLLFAKQLLHDSKLSVEQIAQACGFSSARRLQDNLSGTLNLTPSQIRKQSYDTTTSRSDAAYQTIHMRLAYRPPYCWEHLREFLAIRAIKGVESVGQQSYARWFRWQHTTGWFEVRHRPSRGAFDLTLKLVDLSLIQPIVAQIRRILDLDADPNVIANCLEQAGLPSELQLAGLRLPGIWSSFEAGCRAILGQQVSVKAAINLVTQLTTELGEQCSEGRCFPTPQAVAQSQLEFLRMPSSRRTALIAFAQFISDNGETADLNDWLSIKGVGIWTIAYAKMRGQSDPDVFLNTDLVIRKQMAKLAISKFEPERAAPWRSYLTFQLWSQP